MKVQFQIWAVVIPLLGVLHLPAPAEEEKPKDEGDEVGGIKFDPPGKFGGSAAGKVVKPKVLSEAERKAQLARRTKIGDMLGMGSAGAFCSAAYAFDGVLLFSDEDSFGKARLQNLFAEGYIPTWGELLQSIARQTQTSLSYSEKHGGWLFKSPSKPMPFRITLARGWVQEDRGLYLFCKPPSAKVGLDIYLFGTYSFEQDDAKTSQETRNKLALGLATKIQKGVKLKDMKKVQVDKAEALHIKLISPRGINWRQWVFLKGGHGFAIFSALDSDNEKTLLPQVEAMVNSFKFLSP